MKIFKEKLRFYENKEISVKKASEISEKKGKELDKLKNDLTIMKVKMHEKDKTIEEVRDENNKFYEQLRDLKNLNRNNSVASLPSYNPLQSRK